MFHKITLICCDLRKSFNLQFSSNVEEKPSSAGSRKEKEKDGLKSPVGDLVEVKTSGYSKK